MEGLYDHRLDKQSYNAAPVDEVIAVLNLFETKYSDFNVSHFYDKYRYEYKGTRSYTWIKNQLQKNGLNKGGKRRGTYRKKRERSELKGMLLHQDGSSHKWIQDKEWDLIVTMDDADSEIYSAFFVEEEGTNSSFLGVKEVIDKFGLFCSLYTDRGSHYWYTKEAGGEVNRTNLTQFGRAMSQLGIEMIPAYSPEARGRSERMFGTLQERLPKELKLAGITDMDQANLFLKESYIPIHNKRFMVKPKENTSAFLPFKEGNVSLNDILCIQETRVAKKDNTVNYNGKILQIPMDKYRYNYSKAKIKIHEHLDQTMSLYYGPRLLARYEEDGKLLGLR
jgi:hypothetical protein